MGLERATWLGVSVVCVRVSGVALALGRGAAAGLLSGWGLRGAGMRLTGEWTGVCDHISHDLSLTEPRADARRRS